MTCEHLASPGGGIMSGIVQVAEKAHFRLACAPSAPVHALQVDKEHPGDRGLEASGFQSKLCQVSDQMGSCTAVQHCWLA